jgi:polyisoprenyl-teichoic acid--peptidoglycan teichoic acid transferase
MDAKSCIWGEKSGSFEPGLRQFRPNPGRTARLRREGWTVRTDQLKSLTAAVVLLTILLLPLAALYGWGLTLSAASLGDAFAQAMQRISLLPEDGGEPQSITFLLYGIDAGEWVGGTFRPGPGRADTIVLIRAYPSRKKAALLSIPRDTLVEIPGRPGDDKVNHAYAFGQSALLVETVEHFTGVTVDYYIGLNYLAFKDIVELLGGVEFDVDREIKARGLHLFPGPQHLDGEAAFALISDRQEPLGDIGRVRRQQRFIRSILGEIKNRPLDDLLYVALAAWKNLETNLAPADALRMNRALKGIEETDLTVAVVPGWFYSRGGVSYWRPFLEETETLIEQLFVDPEGEGGSGDA